MQPPEDFREGRANLASGQRPRSGPQRVFILLQQAWAGATRTKFCSTVDDTACRCRRHFNQFLEGLHIVLSATFKTKHDREQFDLELAGFFWAD
jgi:hypothetical protein